MLVATIETSALTSVDMSASAGSSRSAWTPQNVLSALAVVSALSASIAATMGAITQDTQRSPDAVTCYWTAAAFVVIAVLLVMLALLLAARRGENERAVAMSIVYPS